MTVSLKSSVDGTQGIIQVNGNDIVVASAAGLTPATGKTIEATSGPGSSPFSFRNKIINGKMDIAQRGTSFAAAANIYTLDRWLYANTSAAVVTASQQTDVPSNNEFQNSLRLAVTTADTSIAAGDYSLADHRIEGYNVRDLIGRTFTLSFWVRSSRTGTHCVAFRNGGGTPDRSYVLEYTINAANTWEYKTVTVTGGLITAGAWNWTNGTGLFVTWALACGSTFQTTAGSWNTGNFLATANQVNCLDTIGNIFAITGVQLEVGSVATPFEHRPYGAELALCQRYYEVGYVALECGLAGSSARSATWQFKQEKRASPTVAISTSSGTPSVGTVTVYGANISNTSGNLFTATATAAIEL